MCALVRERVPLQRFDIFGSEFAFMFYSSTSYIVRGPRPNLHSNMCIVSVSNNRGGHCQLQVAATSAATDSQAGSVHIMASTNVRPSAKSKRATRDMRSVGLKPSKDDLISSPQKSADWLYRLQGYRGRFSQVWVCRVCTGLSQVPFPAQVQAQHASTCPSVCRRTVE